MAEKQRKKKGKRTDRQGAAILLWIASAVMFAILLVWFVLPSARRTAPKSPDPPFSAEAPPNTEPLPEALFPQALAEQAIPGNAFNLSSYPRTDKRPYDDPFPLYSGSFSEDNVPLEDGRWVIAIDPGHQSRSEVNDIWLSPYLNPENSSSWVRKSQAKIGTRGQKTGIYEYEITMQVALALKAELEQRGFFVILTKDSVDTVMTGPERAKITNRAQADLVLSLHCDGYAADTSARGTLTQVPEYGSSYPDAQLAYLSAMAGEMILDSYSETTGLRRREVQTISTSSAFNWSKSPSVLLEMGFLTNPIDEAFLTDPENYGTIANGISDGIEAYFKCMYATVQKNANSEPS